MANYTTGEFMGRPHYWCDRCGFDTPTETEIIARPCLHALSEPQPSTPEKDAPPALSAPKADWAAYATARGIKVEGKTRKQIIETVEVTQ